MKTTFSHSILRYAHDVATGEFVNMGVALYAPEARFSVELADQMSQHTV